MQRSLFLIPEEDVVPGPSSVVSWSALGSAVEHALIARLLEEGRKVAVPVVDDDGVDLVVDYRIRVQVKSCAGLKTRGQTMWEFEARTPKKDGHSSGGVAARTRANQADVYVFYARDVRVWWVVPSSAFVGSRFKVTPGGLNDRRWREAWGVLDGVEPDA